MPEGRSLRIAVLGLGYVGTTMAACLARAGHAVLGVDVNPAKVALVRAGRSPVVEPGLEALLAEGVAAGRLRAAGALDEEAGEALDLAFVCVGTPARRGGGLDLAQLLACLRELGRAVGRRRGDRQLLIAVRSTVPPGTMTGLVLPTLAAAAGEPPGGRWEAAYHPEFLREASAVADYLAPAKIVIGERLPGSAERLRALHAGAAAPLFLLPLAVAELAKLVDNSWHAVKVAFANEVGRLAVAHGLEPPAVAELLLADAKLNLSAAYLRPGGPYGGSCLPKDLAGTLALGRAAGLDLPVLAGARASNRRHLAWLAAAVQAHAPPPGPILLVGLSFKAGTDDLRGSPLLALARRLVAQGYELAVHDPDVAPARLVGANLAAARRASILALLTGDLAAAAARAKLVVVGKPLAGLAARLPPGLPVLDLTRLQGFGRPPAPER